MSDNELFRSTNWSLIVAAAAAEETTMRDQALAELCQSYWYPCYAYLRRRGHDVHHAEDLTQAFFANLIKNELYNRPDPERGRFRAFLITALKNFVRTDYERQNALKRGGGRIHLDVDAAELRLSLTAASTDPQTTFDREWAQTLVLGAVDRLKTEYRTSGDRFDKLCGMMTGSDNSSQADAAAELGITAEAVKSTLKRMRNRYRTLIREEVAATILDDAVVEDEIQYLLYCLRGAASGS